MKRTEKQEKFWFETQEAERNKKKEDLIKEVGAAKAKELPDVEIVKCKSGLKVADDMIS